MTERALEWNKRLDDALSGITLDYNYFPLYKISIPMPPVIGHTPEKRLRRLFWTRICRVGFALQRAFARYTEAEDDDETLYRRNDWAWLESAGKRSRASMPHPIYDPDWVRPGATKMEWGWGADLPSNVTIGDFSATGDEAE